MGRDGQDVDWNRKRFELPVYMERCRIRTGNRTIAARMVNIDRASKVRVTLGFYREVLSTQGHSSMWNSSEATVVPLSRGTSMEKV